MLVQVDDEQALVLGAISGEDLRGAHRQSAHRTKQTWLCFPPRTLVLMPRMKGMGLRRSCSKLWGHAGMKVAVNSKGNTSIGSAWHTAVTPHCLVEVTTICGQCPCHKVVSAAHSAGSHRRAQAHVQTLHTA